MAWINLASESCFERLLVITVFALYFTSPVLSNGCAVLGEVGKAVPISPQRTAAIRAVENGMEVDIIGSVGETVRMAFWSKAGGVSIVATTIRAGGKATVRSAQQPSETFI